MQQFAHGDVVNLKSIVCWLTPQVIVRIQPDQKGDVAFFRGGFIRVSKLRLVARG